MTAWIQKLLLLLPWVRLKREDSLNAELEDYLQRAEAQSRAAGLSGEDARFAARRDLGSLLRTREETRSEWEWPVVEQVSQDLRFAVRSLKRAPVFTAVAVLSLAVGIGAATAMFTLVNNILLKPLAYRDSEQLVYVQEIVPPLAGVYPTMPVNLEHFIYWHHHTRTFQGLCAFLSSSYTLTGRGEPAQLHAVTASADLFRVLGAEMAEGRGFRSDEDEPGRNSVVVITDLVRRRYFQNQSNVIGSSLVLNGKPVTVVGVLRPDFTFPKNGEFGALASLGSRTDLFRPLQHRIEGWDGDYDYIVIGRLKRGVTQAQAFSELSLLNRQMARAHQVTSAPRPFMQPVQEAIGGSVRTSLLVLQSAVLVLLLIVCVNIANLMLARANSRAREFSIRCALGADRRRLLQQLLTEASLLAALGGGLGITLAAVTVRAFVAQTTVDIPRLDEVHLDGNALLFCLFLTAVCLCLFGFAPAYQTSVRAKARTVGADKHSIRLREILVGSEVALSTSLVFLASLLIASLVHLLHIDKGFREERAIGLDVSLSSARYSGAAARNRFWESALSQLRSLPGVQSAAFIHGLPLTGEMEVNSVQRAGSAADWLDPVSHTQILINVRFVSDRYFETLGIPVLAGRPFDRHDESRKVTVISERFAQKVWPGQSAIGKTFSTGSEVGEVEVIGIVRDTYNGGLDAGPTLMAYVPYQISTPGSGSLVVRSSAADAASLAHEMRQTISKMDANLAVPQVKTMAQLVDESLARRRFQMQLATGFGLAALALALMGVYGVVAYTVEQRLSELGLRMALGARAAELVGLVLRRGMTPVALGLVCGLGLSLWAGSFVRSLAYGVSPSDPLTLAEVLAILGLTAFASCLLPASKAARMDPAFILRHE